MCKDTWYTKVRFEANQGEARATTEETTMIITSEYRMCKIGSDLRSHTSNRYAVLGSVTHEDERYWVIDDRETQATHHVPTYLRPSWTRHNVTA